MLRTASSRMAAQGIASNSARSMASSSDKYLHESMLPTMFFQDSLPHLPIPKLEDTLERYMYCVKPLSDEDALAKTAALIPEFANGVGKKLHQHIVDLDKANSQTNYVSDIWFDMYLKNRDSLPLNLTPQLTWKDAAIPEQNDQATRAANITHAAMRFYCSLRDQQLKPDIFHLKPGVTEHPAFQWAVSAYVPKRVAFYAFAAASGYALDMSQYENLFNSTRIPKPDKDELRKVEKSDYIAVIRGGAVYKVPSLNALGEPLPVEQVEAHLRSILAKDAVAERSAVGALTSEDRDTWAAIRGKMDRNPINRASLKAIDEAMFVLSLEDSKPETYEEINSEMLHGNCLNRWGDKSFNIIVCANGKAGISWEHAWGDGVAVLRFFNEVYDAIESMPVRSQATSPVDVQQLPFDLADSDIGADVESALARVRAQIDSCENKVYRTESLRRKDIKKARLSPDGVMQMALQLAHYRHHGYTPSTYESASTAAFKHGRTETIRSATPESVAFCKAFCDSSVSASDRVAILRTAVDNHSRITKDALMGQGVDRHLSVMQAWAVRMGLETPALFADPVYTNFKDIRLSTSTLASPALQSGGFGPVSQTSYGVGYGIQEEGSQFSVMSYGLGCDRFCEAIEGALTDMRSAIDSSTA